MSIYRPPIREAMAELPAAGESALMKPRISVYSHIVSRQLLHLNGVHHRFQCRQKPLNPHLLQPMPPQSNEKDSDLDVKALHHKGSSSHCVWSSEVLTSSWSAVRFSLRACQQNFSVQWGQFFERLACLLGLKFIEITGFMLVLLIA